MNRLLVLVILPGMLFVGCMDLSLTESGACEPGDVKCLSDLSRRMICVETEEGTVWWAEARCSGRSRCATLVEFSPCFCPSGYTVVYVPVDGHITCVLNPGDDDDASPGEAELGDTAE